EGNFWHDTLSMNERIIVIRVVASCMNRRQRRSINERIPGRIDCDQRFVVKPNSRRSRLTDELPIKERSQRYRKALPTEPGARSAVIFAEPHRRSRDAEVPPVAAGRRPH